MCVHPRPRSLSRFRDAYTAVKVPMIICQGEKPTIHSGGQLFAAPDREHLSSDRATCSCSSTKEVEAGFLDHARVAISKISKRGAPDDWCEDTPKIRITRVESETDLRPLPGGARATKDVINHSSRKLYVTLVAIHDANGGAEERSGFRPLWHRPARLRS